MSSDQPNPPHTVPIQGITQNTIDEGYKFARELLTKCNALVENRPAMVQEIAKLQVMATHVLACLSFNAFKQAQTKGLSISLQDVEDTVMHNFRLEVQNAAENFVNGTTVTCGNELEPRHDH